MLGGQVRIAARTVQSFYALIAALSIIVDIIALNGIDPVISLPAAPSEATFASLRLLWITIAVGLACIVLSALGRREAPLMASVSWGFALTFAAIWLDWPQELVGWPLGWGKIILFPGPPGTPVLLLTDVAKLLACISFWGILAFALLSIINHYVFRRARPLASVPKQQSLNPG